MLKASRGRLTDSGSSSRSRTAWPGIERPVRPGRCRRHRPGRARALPDRGGQGCVGDLAFPVSPLLIGPDLAMVPPTPRPAGSAARSCCSIPASVACRSPAKLPPCARSSAWSMPATTAISPMATSRKPLWSTASRRSQAAAAGLVPPALIVVACNTASTVALPRLRARFAVPVVGVVPAIKPAAALSAKGIIGVLGTEATAQRAYTRDLIERFAGGCRVILVGSADLVRLAETHADRSAPPAARSSPSWHPFSTERTQSDLTSSCSPARISRCCATSSRRPARKASG